MNDTDLSNGRDVHTGKLADFIRNSFEIHSKFNRLYANRIVVLVLMLTHIGVGIGRLPKLSEFEVSSC